MTRLPEELLQLIFSHLHPHGKLSRKTLTSICRVSKQCCRLAQKSLYHRLQVSFLEERSLDEKRSLDLFPAFAAKPHLLTEVRQLEFGGFEADDHEYPQRRVLRGDEELRQITDLVQAQPLSQAIKDEMCAGLMQGSEECEVAVLLAICTRLKVIKVDP